ncbi:MAG: hypothetical protein WCQ32_02530 [bacterium]
MNLESTQKESYLSWKSFIKIFVLLVLFFVLSNSVFSLGKKYLGLRKSINTAKQQQALLDSKKGKLEEETRFLQTPLGQEMELREKYHLVKPDEGMVIIGTPAPEPAPAPRSKIQRFWDMVCSWF